MSLANIVCNTLNFEGVVGTITSHLQFSVMGITALLCSQKNKKILQNAIKNNLLFMFHFIHAETSFLLSLLQGGQALPEGSLEHWVCAERPGQMGFCHTSGQIPEMIPPLPGAARHSRPRGLSYLCGRCLDRW